VALNTPPPSGDAQPPAEGQVPPTEGQPPADGTPPQTPPTVEDVNAQWEHRVSQKDKAHAAAEKALRDENDALRRQMLALSEPRAQSNGQSGTQGEDPTVTALREELARQRREVEDERKRASLEARKAKYPSLAKSVGEAGIDIFGTADEATLAKLNAQLDDGSSGQGTFAPTSPRRAAAAAKPKAFGEMDKGELEAQLRDSIERGALQRR
jgi:hypothetical protein